MKLKEKKRAVFVKRRYLSALHEILGVATPKEKARPNFKEHKGLVKRSLNCG